MAQQPFAPGPFRLGRLLSNSVGPSFARTLSYPPLVAARGCARGGYLVATPLRKGCRAHWREMCSAFKARLELEFAALAASLAAFLGHWN